MLMYLDLFKLGDDDVCWVMGDVYYNAVPIF